MGDTQTALIEGQTSIQVDWGNGFGEKQYALITEQTSCLYWGINRLSLLGDKQVGIIGGQTYCPNWGMNRLPLFKDKQVALIEEQTGCLY